MRKIEKTYSLFLDPSFIEDYLPNVKLPSPHLQFKQIVDADCFDGYEEQFPSKEEEKEFIRHAKKCEMDDIARFSLCAMFGDNDTGCYNQLLNLLTKGNVPEGKINEIISCADIYLNELKSNIELKFVK